MRIKTFRSGMAATASTLILNLLQAFTVILLARILVPKDFGIVSLAAALIGIFTLFSGLGINSALIASGEETNRVAFHALLITTTIGSLFTVLVLGFAPAYASLFGGSELAEICQWMAVIVLFNALSVVPDGVLVKRMMFGRRIIPATASSLSYMVVAVGMAYSGFGLWSLVYGQIIGSFVTFITNLLVCPTLRWLRPHKWDGLLAKNLTRFGVTTLGTAAMQYAYEYGDKLVVGKVFGTTQLGFYSQAYSLSALAVGRIASITNAVLFPAYTKIRDNKERLAKAFLNSLQMLSAITIPFSMGLLILAPELVIFLIGEKWRDSIPLLQIFAFLGLIRPISGAASPLLLAMNQPKYNLYGSFIQGGSMVALVLVLIQWGVAGVALSLVGAYALGFLYNIYVICWKIGLPIVPRDFLVQVTPAIVGTITMVGVVHWLKEPMLNMVNGTHNVLSLCSLILAGIVGYGLTLYAVKPSLVFEIIKIVLAGIGLGGKASRPVEMGKE